MDLDLQSPLRGARNNVVRLVVVCRGRAADAGAATTLAAVKTARWQLKKAFQKASAISSAIADTAPSMDSPISPVARIIFTGMSWLPKTFDSSSSLDDDDDDDETSLDGYDEDPFDDDLRRARRQYHLYARRRSARLSSFRMWVGRVRRASRERADREVAPLRRHLDRWRLPPRRRHRSTASQKTLAAVSCLAVAMGLGGTPYDPFEEIYPDRLLRKASWRKLSARYVRPAIGI